MFLWELNIRLLEEYLLCSRISYKCVSVFTQTAALLLFNFQLQIPWKLLFLHQSLKTQKLELLLSHPLFSPARQCVCSFFILQMLYNVIWDRNVWHNSKQGEKNGMFITFKCSLWGLYCPHASFKSTRWLWKLEDLRRCKTFHKNLHRK